jgi:hypothetical protein
MASGVGPDAGIERLWHYYKTAQLGTALKAMGVEFATAPNYSFFVYAPRTHFVWNRRRTLLFADELGSETFPVIPHLYGETSFDWDWWASFYKEATTLNAFTIELQTADANPARAIALVNHLIRFQEKVARPLHAFIAGGRHAIPLLAPAFPNLTVFECSAYMKTIKSRCAHLTGEKIRWQRTQTSGSLDALFDHNVRVSAEALCVQVERARAHTGRIGMAAA